MGERKEVFQEASPCHTDFLSHPHFPTGVSLPLALTNLTPCPMSQN